MIILTPTFQLMNSKITKVGFIPNDADKETTWEILNNGTFEVADDNNGWRKEITPNSWEQLCIDLVLHRPDGSIVLNVGEYYQVYRYSQKTNQVIITYYEGDRELSRWWYDFMPEKQICFRFNHE